MDYGSFLKEKRNQNNLTLNDVSEYLGYSTQSVYAWENNKASPELSVWAKYARILKLDLEAFLYGVDKYRNDFCDNNEFDASEFTNRLNYYRKKKHLTQKQVARFLNVNHKTVSSWERGNSSPSIKHFIELCELFGIKPNHLYFGIYETHKEEIPKRNRVILIPIIIVLGSLTVGGGTAGGIILAQSLNNTASDHQKSEDWSYDEHHHWHACLDCDEKYDISDHRYSLNITNPSFEDEGNESGICVDCGYSYSKVLPKLEHNYSSTYTYDYYDHWKVCIDEGYESLTTEKESHHFTSETDDHNLITYTCSDCGYTYTDDTSVISDDFAFISMIDDSGNNTINLSNPENIHINILNRNNLAIKYLGFNIDGSDGSIVVHPDSQLKTETPGDYSHFILSSNYFVDIHHIVPPKSIEFSITYVIIDETEEHVNLSNNSTTINFLA